MLYDVRVENRGCRDLLIAGVDEKDLGEEVARWCGEHTVVVVTQSEEQEGGNDETEC